MNQQEATEYVIHELGKHRQKNDIIQKLCETTGMNWTEAEKFMHQVRAQHGGQIARNQSPLITVMSLGFVIAGFAISIFILYETLNGLIIFFLRLPIPYLGNLTYFLIGVGMIAGGIRGTWDTIVQMWNG